MKRDEPFATTDAGNAMAPLLPPGWEMIDWRKGRGALIVRARRDDGFETSVQIATLPMACEQYPLSWLRQVLDLKLLWAAS